GNGLRQPEAFAAIMTRNEAMLGVFAYVERIARTQYPVFITGEAGTGKELVAEVLHNLSGRAGKFITINIAGLDDTVFSDTLFGHRRGAFTGAGQDRAGLLEQAAGGTIFLDEIGDLSPANQVKLLRLIQEGEFYPLGDDRPRKSDARVLVATNRDLASLQADPSFRDDLYYRLKIHHLHLPPLRNRLDDLPLLIAHFLAEASASEGRKPPEVDQEIIRLLRDHSFPGNVRELKAMVCDALSLSPGRKLQAGPFRTALGQPGPAALVPVPAEEEVPPLEARIQTLKEAEKSLIAEALRRTGGNQQQAARLLGITRQALNRRLNRAKLKGEEGRAGSESRRGRAERGRPEVIVP
nr:sigma-54 dependent transcriptional regulator [Desulfobacteraceae bacterium]